MTRFTTEIPCCLAAAIFKCSEAFFFCLFFVLFVCFNFYAQFHDLIVIELSSMGCWRLSHLSVQWCIL